MGNSWSYAPNDQYKPTQELVKKLVDIVSKGGNYLLNIGPGPDGEFAAAAYERLKDIGKWMKINGEGIYGTRMNKVFGEGENIRFTKSKDGNTQFIFLFAFPETGKVNISKIDIPAGAKLTMLGGKKNLKWKKTEAGYEITIPAEMKASSEWAWAVKVTSH